MQWFIDPIQSFAPDERGKRDIKITLTNGEMMADETLLLAGRRAFDIFQYHSEEPLTIPTVERMLLAKFKNWRSVLDMAGYELTPFTENRELSESDFFEIEPMIWHLANITERVVLARVTGSYPDRKKIDLYEEAGLSPRNFPYGHELLAAIFTLVHVNVAAGRIKTALTASSTLTAADVYLWATRWFEKLDNIEHIHMAARASDRAVKQHKSQKMNERRHRKRNNAYQLVTDDWSKRTSDWSSAAKAGEYYVDWLQEQGFDKYRPSTMTEWILKYAKDNDIRLR